MLCDKCKKKIDLAERLTELEEKIKRLESAPRYYPPVINPVLPYIPYYPTYPVWYGDITLTTTEQVTGGLAFSNALRGSGNSSQ